MSDKAKLEAVLEALEMAGVAWCNEEQFARLCKLARLAVEAREMIYDDSRACSASSKGKVWLERFDAALAEMVCDDRAALSPLPDPLESKPTMPDTVTPQTAPRGAERQ